MVVDMKEAAECIREAVAEAEELSGLSIKTVYVGLSGAHVQCLQSYGATGIKGKVVAQGDVQRVLESASALYVPLDREVLHVLPSEYIIDSQEPVLRPLGMSGVRLEVRVQVITASVAVLQNLQRVLQSVGLRVAEMVFQPLATAQAVLSEEERRQGVLLVDLGGGTTHLALFKAGTLRHAAVLPVGGAHLTNDLAVGLKLSQSQAEALKLKHGGLLNGQGGATALRCTTLSGRPLQVHPQELVRILRPRCQELFELLKVELSEHLLRHRPCSVVLTGGGAALQGILEMAEAELSLPARLGLPQGLGSALLGEGLRRPQYAASAGLLLYGLQAEGPPGRSLWQGLLQDMAQGWLSLKRIFTRWGKSQA
jgi:cell division protein FtsA